MSTPDVHESPVDRDALLSIQEASALFAVPSSTIRRRIAQGEIAGAFKQRGARGMEWRLPESSLIGLGYRRAGTPTSTATSSTRVAEALKRLSGSLQAERRRWQEWDRRLGWARVEIARLRGELGRAYERNLELERKLAELGGGEVDLRDWDPMESSSGDLDPSPSERR